MDESAALVAIHGLRTQATYQEAERLRRRTKGGAAELVKGKDDSAELAAVHLLVNTWETIASIIEGVESKDRIFEVTPVCHMHRNLKDAIADLGIRHAKVKEFGAADMPNNGYGAKFNKLANDYDNWLLEKHKTQGYITGACDGMYACFG
jgi:hypothetical protein